jgi:glycosyltransferase 2 family protein
VPPLEASRPARGEAAARARRWALRLALAAAVLAALVAVVPRDELTRALGAVPATVWLAAPLAFLAVHLVGVFKWRLLVNAAGAGLSARIALRCYLFGLFGNLFLPSVVGGDAVRAGLALPHSRSASALLLSSLVDRLLDLAALAALAGAATLALPATVAPAERGLLRTVATAVLLAGAAAVAALWKLPFRRLPYRLRRFAAAARRAFRRLRRRPAILLAAFALGAALQLALLGLAVWLGRHAGVEAPLLVWLVVWPLAKLAALAPVTQGGIGVREAALVALFRPFGVPAAAALATGLLFEAMLVGGSLLAGLVAAALRGFAARVP